MNLIKTEYTQPDETESNNSFRFDLNQLRDIKFSNNKTFYRNSI